MIEFLILMSVMMLAFSRRLTRPFPVTREIKVCGGEQTSNQTVIQIFFRAASVILATPMTPGIPASVFHAMGGATRFPFATPGLQPIMRDTRPNASGSVQPLFIR